MNICMLLEDEYPPDIRVRKEARALLEEGHSVTLLCHLGADEPAFETVEGVDVRRKPLQHAHSGVSGFLAGTAYMITHVHHPWAEAINRVCEASDIDVIHVHDLPLVKTALEVARPRGIRVIADLHENWPEAVRQYRRSDGWRRYVQEPTYLLSTLALPIWRWKRLERTCVRRVDHVITVVEEAKTHYVRDCGVVPEKVSVVSNVVSLDQFDVEDVAPKPIDGDFVLSYVGTLGGKHRGLEAVIEAMPEICAKIPEARLLIVGSGSDYEHRLRALCQELGVRDHVDFTGWVDFEEVPSYITASDVCLVPHASTAHTETTVPHKLFQYMALGKPTIVTDVAPLKRIVEETGCGLVVPAGDSAAMADAALSLAADSERAVSLGERGRQAVAETYNWQSESTKLTALYEAM